MEVSRVMGGYPQNHPTFDHFSIETTMVLLGIHGLKTRHHPPYPRRSRQGTLMQDPLRSQDGSHSSSALELVWEPQGIRFVMDQWTITALDLLNWTRPVWVDFFNGRIVCFFGRGVFQPRKETLARTSALLGLTARMSAWESQPDLGGVHKPFILSERDTQS